MPKRPAMLRTRRSPIVAAPVLMLALTVLTSCQDATSPAPAESASSDYQPHFSAASSERGAIPDRYIIGFQPGVADAAAVARDLARAHGGTVHFTYTEALSGAALSVPGQAVEALRRNPNVAFVEADQVVVADDVIQTSATWGLDRIDQRALPLSRTYSYVTNGAGVTVYIFDTGIRFDHVEFGGRAKRGYDAIGDGRNGADCNGHGTHVAGTVGGKTYGVAKGVQLVSVRVLNCAGSGSYSGMIAGIDWVLKNRTSAAVANFSLGGSVSSTLNSAVAKLIAAGVATAVSAGNDAKDACTQSPAATADAVTVGATTSTDARASYSNYGRCLDLFAPGSGIVSASWSTSTGSRTMSGTSMATPHAAGVLALLKAQRPDLTALQLRDWLVSLATRNIVTSSLSTAAHLLNSRGTVTVVEPPPPTGVPAAPTSLTGSLSNGRVTLTWRDNSTNETGFKIQRRTGTGSWLYLATAGANATSYPTTFPTTGYSYSYRVYAYNSAGNSTYTNEVTIAP